MKKVAFVINYNHIKWLGGFQVVLNLIKSISLNKNHKIKPILFLGYKINDKISEIDKNTKIIVDKRIIINSNFLKILDKIFTIFFGYSFWYTKIFSEHKIDLISHSNIALGKKNKIKSVVWIPDFQFLHLKYLYSRWQIFTKKINARFYSKHSTKILLSSKSSKSDLMKIIKTNNQKLIINSFPFDVPSPSNLLSKKQLKQKLKIPNNYFYLPNYYWLHKNHMVVLKTLNILKKKKYFCCFNRF